MNIRCWFKILFQIREENFNNVDEKAELSGRRWISIPIRIPVSCNEKTVESHFRKSTGSVLSRSGFYTMFPLNIGHCDFFTKRDLAVSGQAAIGKNHSENVSLVSF
jgi:hypothetical protein